MTNKLTVILPTYNIERYLRECLDSVVKQTYKNLEIIILDDNSSDSTPDIIKEYAAKDERIKPVFHTKNHGPGNTRNEGLDKATGDYVTLMDHDDWQELDKYEKMMAAIIRHEADFALCDAAAHDQKSGVKTRKTWQRKMQGFDPEKPLDITDWDIKLKLLNIYIPPWAKIVSRRLINANKMVFSVGDNLFDDMLYHYHLMLVAKKATFVPETLYYHRYFPASISGQWADKGDLKIITLLQIWQDIEKICQQNNIPPQWIFKAYIKLLAKSAYRADNSRQYIAEIRDIINRLGMQKSDFPKQYRIYYQNVMHYSWLRRFVGRAIRKSKLRMQIAFGKKSSQ